MDILAISGSLRRASTNTALLAALTALATPPLHVTLFAGLADLPPFNPDQEGALTPAPVRITIFLIGPIGFAPRHAELRTVVLYYVDIAS